MSTKDAAYILLIILIFCLLRCSKKENFGYSEKPFEPDNSVPMQNPWDNIDYIKPKYLTN
jgi:hypothetical protein